ncbi:purine-binding chemotaxis protein CheW [Desulfallas sp. Bu1-1]|uniref:chemotaxis protein CheW n=1 Tax=Desulfallas sp. Bu1-1 TaxID=2787620 RepID=UPI00189DBF07|nr:chemotaxis protein CheW [Desulfallas sp. Bu1-1]MBF7081992.1 purine-binding chemotaxis protein CheW [Desulfallas sp. Bu1-1]
MAVGASNTNDLQVVVFSITEQYFGIDISSVSEIIRLEKITPIPQAPVYVEGVINIRGRVIPVINLHELFNVQLGERSDSNRVVIVEVGGQKFGLIVEAVYEVRKISPDMIHPAPTAISLNQNYLEGIILDGENLIVLINLKKLLSEQDLDVLKAMEESA